MLHQLSGAGGVNRSGSPRYSGAGTRVVLETNDPVLETLALQRLKDLAPLALCAGAPSRLPLSSRPTAFHFTPRLGLALPGNNDCVAAVTFQRDLSGRPNTNTGTPAGRQGVAGWAGGHALLCRKAV